MSGEGLAVNAFQQVAQPSRDLERSVAFYRDVLGARYIGTFDPPGLAFFDIGGVRLMLDAIPGAIEHEGSPLYFRVDSLTTDRPHRLPLLSPFGLPTDRCPTHLLLRRL